MRWRIDGGNYILGSNKVDGTGGMVSWHVNPFHYKACVWVGAWWKEFKRKFKSEDAAKRLVEKWLSRRSSK